jgi:hypothetical protein
MGKQPWFSQALETIHMLLGHLVYIMQNMQRPVLSSEPSPIPSIKGKLER